MAPFLFFPTQFTFSYLCTKVGLDHISPRLYSAAQYNSQVDLNHACSLFKRFSKRFFIVGC